MKETDQQLIELLEQKTPDELTLEEIEHLHRQLTTSAELRLALRDQLRFEQSLADALGRVNVSVDSIFEQAKRQRARNWRFAWLGMFACVAVGLGIWYQLYGQGMAPPVAKAPAEDVPPVADEPALDTPDEPEAPPKVPAEGVRKTEKVDETKPNDEPKPDPPPAEPKRPKTGPWTAADQLGGPKVPLAQLLARDSKGNELLTAELAKQWLLPVDRHPSRIKYTARPSRVEVEGLHQLAAPWPNDALLRINADHRQDNAQRWYFWHGANGVLVQPDFGSRATVRMHAVTRTGDSPLPDTIESVASGSSHWFRDGMPGAGWLDIRHQDGELVVGYSGIRLASAPLAGVPTDVYFEGKDSVYAIRMARTEPYPPKAIEPPTAIAEFDRPASLDWKTSEENAEALERGDDGSIRLASKVANKSRHAWFDIKFDPKAPFREWVFELSDVTAGTSVYFGNATGGRMQEVRVVRDPKTKRNHLRAIDGDNVIERSPDHNGRRTAWVGDRLWLRLIVVGPYYRSYASRDGVRWTDLGPFAKTDTIATLGISAAHPNRDEHPTIIVSKVHVRGYQAINSLAKPDLIAAAQEHVSALKSASSEDKWESATIKSKPDKVSLNDWQIACAVATFAQAANNKGSVAQILRTCVDSTRDLPAKLQLFDEVATVAPLKPDEGKSIGEILKQQYARLAGYEIAKGSSRPFSEIGERALRSPMEANARPIILADAAAHEIVSLVDDRELDLAGQLAARLERLHSKELASTIAWANAVARKDPSVASADWKHP
ncbi:MAG: DUF1349 domain-containing protein, partial [Pirellulales bacterium]|nr:DUF1349 domain-containing protein [Pirellulales bacterium]